MADKTLLILGNGFDKAHTLKSTGKPLPTGYMDFLDYIESKHKNAFATIYEVKPLNISIADKTLPIETFAFNLEIPETKILNQIRQALHSGKFDEVYKRVNDYIDENVNFWLLLFHQRRQELGNLWIDFENEIARVISFLEQQMLNGEANIPKKFDYLKNLLPKSGNLSAEEIQLKLIPHLEMDLKHLMILLDKYLTEQVDRVNKDDIDEYPAVAYIEYNIQAVISYNYTHTFEHLYGEELGLKQRNYGFDDQEYQIYHIHGEVGAGYIVLGAGETLEDKDIPSMVWCNSFKKYFQRIYFRLSDDYRAVVDDYGEDMTPEWNVVIYGHSLDVTDKDSLAFIMNSSLVEKITIYYYDNNALKRQIMNAIQILGKDKLTKWVARGKLQFRNVGE